MVEIFGGAHRQAVRKGAVLKGTAERWLVLDVFRGLACLAVLLFHSLNAFKPEELHPLLEFLQKGTRYGWLAVHVFFVLSGWCMAERVSISLRTGEHPGRFALNRMFRIYPVYWAALALSILLRLLASLWTQIPTAQALRPTPGSFWVDVLLLYEACPQHPYLLVAWSLGVEVILYAACTLAIGLSRLGFQPPGILAFAALSSSFILFWPFEEGRTFFECWPHFLWGVLAWRLCSRDGKRPAYALLFILSAIPGFVSSEGRMADLAALAFTLALIFLRLFHYECGTGTASRLLVGLGTVSYSLYLIHVPVLSPFLNLAKRFLPPSDPLFIGAWLASLAAATLSGLLVYGWVEKNTERWRKYVLPGVRKKISL